MSDYEFMSLDHEVQRILNTRRQKGNDAARSALNAILDRPRRLTGLELRTALDFNAQLVTILRQRQCNLWSAPAGTNPDDSLEATG